jgi:hypothetical protein
MRRAENATSDRQPYGEPLRTTLTRTVGIAVVAGALVALSVGRLTGWPIASLLLLWPAVGGHWIDLFFLNRVRPHLPRARGIQAAVRIAVWFAGGVVLAVGVRLTARLLLERPRMAWLTWVVAGALFIASELLAHAALQLRGKASFYNGAG